MNEKDLYLKDNKIYRIVHILEDKLLVIDCIKRDELMWVEKEYFNHCELVNQDYLLEKLDISFISFNDMTAEQKRTAEKHALLPLRAVRVPPFPDAEFRNI